MASVAPNKMETPVENDLRGKAFYPAGVIAAYCVVCLPVGFLLYGLNLIRRRSLVMGWSLTISSAVLLIAIIASVVVYDRGLDVFLLAVVAAIFIIKTEAAHYHRSLRRGGSKARWWPPALLVLLAFIATGVIATFFGPTPPP